MSKEKEPIKSPPFSSTSSDDIEVIISSKTEDGTTIITTTSETMLNSLIEKATYDFQNKEHVYSRLLSSLDSGNQILSQRDLDSLALNPQDNLEKILRINQLAKFYINKDDLIGKVYETIESNVNTDIKINFQEVSKSSRNKNKARHRAEELIEDFNTQINVKNLLRKAIPMTYVEGNYIMYLRNNNGTYVVDYFPLGVAEISPYEIDGEPIVLINMAELKSRLVSAGYTNKKGKSLFMVTIEDEIKANYPKEVYDAYINKEKYAKLNPENTGVVRINNMNGRYGLTPVFKSLSPQLMLDVLATTDKNNAAAKGKKIIVQLMRAEMIKDTDGTFASDKWMLAHSELMKAWKNPVVVYTALPFVEDMKYVESKTEQMPIETINYYKNKVLMALGISFLSVENKSSYVISEINIKELMKTINKLSEQIAVILKKWYSIVLRDNGIDPAFTPDVEVFASDLLEMEMKIKLSDTIFSKFGASYKSTFEILGYDMESELIRRQEENEFEFKDPETGETRFGLDKIFTPRLSAFTASGKDLNQDENKFEKDNPNKNLDKKKQDKKRSDSKLSDI